ncbi:hypothetical protein [Flavobacterium sp.]|uniref:hypothetical protein n=1 Tax=Flavobacterium sp. TaxID=239 RepID=UPI00391CF211
MFPTNFNTKDITFSEHMENMFNCILPDYLAEAMFNDQFNGHGFPSMKPDFDENGLRFDVHFLNKIGLTISILPIQALAQFVDYVTYSNYKNDQQNFEQEIADFTAFQETDFEHINATALGNMAFIYLNTENPLIKQKIKIIIITCARETARAMGILKNFKPELSIPKTDYKC